MPQRSGPKLANSTTSLQLALGLGTNIQYCKAKRLNASIPTQSDASCKYQFGGSTMERHAPLLPRIKQSPYRAVNTPFVHSSVCSSTIDMNASNETRMPAQEHWYKCQASGRVTPKPSKGHGGCAVEHSHNLKTYLGNRCHCVVGLPLACQSRISEIPMETFYWTLAPHCVPEQAQCQWSSFYIQRCIESVPNNPGAKRRSCVMLAACGKSISTHSLHTERSEQVAIV
jgi:hypothetical protein